MTFFDKNNLSDHEGSNYPDLVSLAKYMANNQGLPFWSYRDQILNIFKSSFATVFVRNELCKIAYDDQSNKLLTDFGIELIRFPEFSLWIGRIRAASFWSLEDAKVTSFANDVFCYNLGPGQLNIEFYSAPPEQNNRVFDRGSKLLFDGREKINSGQDFSIFAGNTVIKVDDPIGEAFQLYAVSSEKCSLVWHYGEDNLTPIYCTAANEQDSTIQQAIEILVYMGAKDKAAELKPIFSHREHFVRWTVVKAALALDKEIGTHLLELACKDSHPHLKEVAMKTKSMLGLDSTYSRRD